jgi:hypothetical protein
MPYLYFWEPEDQNHGILQAVLPWGDCDRVIDSESAIRLGDEFPSGSINGHDGATVVILYVRAEEANDKWFAGFYRINTDVTKIYETLADVPENPAAP